MLPSINCPYKGWHLYMKESYREALDSVRLLKIFEGFYMRNKQVLKGIGDNSSFLLDVELLFKDEAIVESIADLQEKLIANPQYIISLLSLAAYQTLLNNLEISIREEAKEIFLADKSSIDSEAIEDSILNDSLPAIHARLINFRKYVPIRNLKSSHYGNLVSLRGTVVKISSVKPYCTELAFKCLRCNAVQCVSQFEGNYTIPSNCSEDLCQSSLFLPERNHPKHTRIINSQTIWLQEITCEREEDGGRVPRAIECDIKEDLVNSCLPGDVVTIVGTVKVARDEENKSFNTEKSYFSLYIDVNSVVSSKSEEDATIGIEFSVKDYYAIEKIQSEPALFKLLVGSLCPLIYGHEMVKAGLILSLFGGCSKNKNFDIPVRGEIHFLVVGDPGLGKSQLLRACSTLAPRGVYVCGNTTTSSGLTVTLCKEPGGDFALEGGALVLADRGVCCIDEFDKMVDQHQTLLEAMEQQTISIAKAGIVCCLPARTSILAAANPVGGHYNRSKTVSENIRINGPLLSRFDLVFILFDKSDAEWDCLLSEHVMSMHQDKGDRLVSKNLFVSTPTQDLLNTSVCVTKTTQSLLERLKYIIGDHVDYIPYQLLRKYICYARKYVHPKLTPGASSILQSFYLELRQKFQSSDSTPITTRQLESLIRLSEARARCELREEVTENDAKEVIEVMKFSMIDTYSDDLGLLDFRRSQHGSGPSNVSQAKKFIASLQKKSESSGQSVFTVDEMRKICDENPKIQIRDFNDFLSRLNHQGFLLKKGPRSYQLSISL